MDKKHLIRIVEKMDCNAKYGGFYHFAHNIIVRINNDEKTACLSGKEKIDLFFSYIKFIRDRIEWDVTVKSAMNISGKKIELAKEWCSFVNLCKVLSFDDLNYVISVCERCCRMNRKGINTLFSNSSSTD